MAWLSALRLTVFWVDSVVFGPSRALKLTSPPHSTVDVPVPPIYGPTADERM